MTGLRTRSYEVLLAGSVAANHFTADHWREAHCVVRYAQFTLLNIVNFDDRNLPASKYSELKFHMLKGKTKRLRISGGDDCLRLRSRWLLQTRSVFVSSPSTWNMANPQIICVKKKSFSAWPASWPSF
jgi:hypothetical protein